MNFILFDGDLWKHSMLLCGCICSLFGRSWEHWGSWRLYCRPHSDYSPQQRTHILASRYASHLLLLCLMKWDMLVIKGASYSLFLWWRRLGLVKIDKAASYDEISCYVCSLLLFMAVKNACRRLFMNLPTVTTHTSLLNQWVIST